MAKGFLNIPDWFSFENQGGGVATADLSGSGQQDLVAFMVDNPPGQNRGLYRIGRDLDASGNVTGGFTPWIDVPDWFSFENQGAGVAVADIDKDGKQDLIVFMIDNPPGQRRTLPGWQVFGRKWQRERRLGTVDSNPRLVLIRESVWLDRSR
jgi:hypothetical protein